MSARKGWCERREWVGDLYARAEREEGEGGEGRARKEGRKEGRQEDEGAMFIERLLAPSPSLPLPSVRLRHENT